MPETYIAPTIAAFNQNKQETKILNQIHIDALAKLMLDVDVKLQHGFSKELIARALMSDIIHARFGKKKLSLEEPSKLGQEMLAEKSQL